MKRRTIALGALGLVAVVVVSVVSVPALRDRAVWAAHRVRGRRTVEQRLAEFGPAVEGRLRGDFLAARVALPPPRALIAVFKQQRRVELYGEDAAGALRFVRAWPVLAASGRIGPKLAAGDLQVPEGLYAIESLNPESTFHVALRLGYPNAEDRAHAADDGRSDLGGDIMIHGKDRSIGCVAVGDAAAEELFWIAARSGAAQVGVLIAPTDFRIDDVRDPESPGWVAGLYARLRDEVRALPAR